MRAGAEFIMQVLGDAGAFLLHRPVLFDALAFLDLFLELNRALFDFPMELGDPQHGDHEDARERANHD